MWYKIKKDLRQRLATYETFKGFIFLFWGAGFLYYAEVDIAGGYEFAMRSVAVYLIIEAVRHISINRVKWKAKFNEMVKEAERKK